MAGKIIAVNGPVVQVEFDKGSTMPRTFEILRAKTLTGRIVTLEVMEHVGDVLVMCISLNSTMDLRRGTEVEVTGEVITIPVGKPTLGRLMNVMGEPIDGLGEIKAEVHRPTRTVGKEMYLNPEEGAGNKFEILETGIKMIDLLFPLIKGTKTGVLGGAALGKSLLTLEIIHNVIDKHQGSCIFTGVGERIREGQELFADLERMKILDRVSLVYAQMDEPPGSRFEAVFTGITLAEYLQEQKRDILFFADSIYRYAQAGMEVSALLGHIPSETGYQPTLSAEMSEFNERIRTRKDGSITAVEAVYVPADDLTDPAVVAIFSHLDSMMVLSRARVQAALYPAIDPIVSSSANLDIDIVGEHHYEVAMDVLRTLKKLEELKYIVSVIGIEELSPEDRTMYDRGLRMQNFMTQPFFTAQTYTGMKGHYVPVEKTLQGCRDIMDGEYDNISERQFYMIGPVDPDNFKEDSHLA